MADGQTLCLLVRALSRQPAEWRQSARDGQATVHRLLGENVRSALRMAAQSLRKRPSYLGAFSRRMRSKLGPAKATTAPAHKLAKILYHLLQEKTPYRERGAEAYRHTEHERQLRPLRKQAQHLGFALGPHTSN